MEATRLLRRNPQANCQSRPLRFAVGISSQHTLKHSRPARNQCTVFRAWQGWTSLSTTKANEGTLRVVPLLKLSTAYVMLRPFFKPRPGRETSLEADDWEPNLEHGEFHGTSPGCAQTLSSESHPHLQFEKTFVSIDLVEPGDQVYCMFVLRPRYQQLT